MVGARPKNPICMRAIWAAKQAEESGDGELRAAGDDGAATEVLSKAMRHDRQAVMAAKRTARTGAAEQNQQG